MFAGSRRRGARARLRVTNNTLVGRHARRGSASSDPLRRGNVVRNNISVSTAERAAHVGLGERRDVRDYNVCGRPRAAGSSLERDEHTRLAAYVAATGADSHSCRRSPLTRTTTSGPRPPPSTPGTPVVSAPGETPSTARRASRARASTPARTSHVRRRCHESRGNATTGRRGRRRCARSTTTRFGNGSSPPRVGDDGNLAPGGCEPVRGRAERTSCRRGRAARPEQCEAPARVGAEAPVPGARVAAPASRSRTSPTRRQVPWKWVPLRPRSPTRRPVRRRHGFRVRHDTTRRPRILTRFAAPAAARAAQAV